MLAFATSGFLFLTIAMGAMALFGPSRFGRRGSEERILGLTQQKGDNTASTATFKRPHSSIPSLGRLLSESDWAVSASQDLARANIHLRVGEYLLLRIGIGVGAFLIIGLVAQFHILAVLLGLVTGAGIYLAIPSFLHLLRQRRLAKIEKQLVEFLHMIASSLQAGFAFQQGVELAAKQLEPPLGDELALMLNDTNLGSTMDEALLQMGERIGSTDVDMLITAVLVQRSTGGNLVEILESAAKTLTERERIRGDIQTLTASQRLTGMILSLYPTAVGLLLLVIMPSLWKVMFTETLGLIFLGIALGLQFIGFLVMRRVTQIQI